MDVTQGKRRGKEKKKRKEGWRK